MSERFRKHYPEAQGAIIDQPGVGIIFASKAAAPTASASGYAPGCIFVNTAGSIGSFVYANTGTKTSATWTNLL